MKFLQIHTFYPVYLESFYAKRPGLAQQSYDEQMRALVMDGFSAAHLFAPYLGAYGYDSTLVVANCQPTQLRWLNEQVADLGTSEITVFDAARMQVEMIKPDVLYLSDSIAFDSRFVRSLSWKPKLILGWRAAVINDGTDWSEFDLILSGLGALRRFALKLGARHAECFFPGYPAWANDVIGKVPVEHDVVFSGQWNPGQHGNRNEYLRQIARASRTHGFSASFNLLGNDLPPEVAVCSREAVFGVDMHRALAAGRIVFDARATHVAKDPVTGSMIDLSGKETANMRIIEATGCGRFLLTERFENLGEYFEVGREIETFSGPGELIEKINHYLRHPAEREEIARRGQERCLREYSMEMRAGELDRLIRKHLVLKGPAVKVSVAEALEAVGHEMALNPGHAEARQMQAQLNQALIKPPRPMIPTSQRSYNTSLPRETLLEIQNTSHNYSYRGVPMIKNPFDFAIYPILLWDKKPRTIIEIGSKDGGSALWLGDMLDNFGIDGHIYSLDIVGVKKVSHPRVTFLQGDGRDLAESISPELMHTLPRPLLVIEDADHSYETSSHVLSFFHRYLDQGETIVIENGIISDLAQDPSCSSGPHLALKEFLARHAGSYEIEGRYCDYFGYNLTWCTNGFLQRTAPNPDLPAAGVPGSLVFPTRRNTPYPENHLLDKKLIREFHEDDPVKKGVESQMSVNERFQLYSLVRNHLSRGRKKKPLRFVEIGSYSGASLLLQHQALARMGAVFQGICVEPGGTPQFHEIVKLLSRDVVHMPLLSHDAAKRLGAILDDDALPELIFVDGDHAYAGVRQDILDYYPLLAPGGIMVFHDYLPELDEENRAAIHQHHDGSEPGVRRACRELMEESYRCQQIELPLLYPSDPTQTQPHLPIIPGVFSTVRAYRKPVVD